MKWFSIFCSLCFVLFFASCKKEGFITSTNAFIITSDTALHFDTVFTTTGSITKQLKIFNINDQKLRLSNLELMGGTTSYFKMNVNGQPGTQFSNLDIAAGDSIYVFVTVNIPQGSTQLPFIIEDSIQILYNGNKQMVGLDAYGQNANFYKSKIIIHDTTWTNNLPFVLMDSFAIAAGATLIIEKGVKVYAHANTPLYIAGTLKINGGKDTADRVTFLNDRLDAPYSNQPGTWRGLYFSASSTGNVLNYTVIKNALEGIAADNQSAVTLNQCAISNCANAGIITYNATLNATNCLISNCGNNVYVTGGGKYTFTNCTLATYSTQYVYHQAPVLSLDNGNTDGTETNPLNALLRNCIVYGDNNVGDEVAVYNQSGAAVNIVFENTLYKSPADNPSVTYTNCIQNADPYFALVDLAKNDFDFHLQAGSICADAGVAGTTIDLDGKTRNALPDLGCYEIE